MSIKIENLNIPRYADMMAVYRYNYKNQRGFIFSVVHGEWAALVIVLYSQREEEAI